MVALSELDLHVAHCASSVETFDVPSRVATIRDLAKTLRATNGRIVDNRGAFLERSRAKDLLQRLELSLHYQLALCAAVHGKVKQRKAYGSTGDAVVQRGLMHRFFTPAK